jgi:hypothetical protein
MASRVLGTEDFGRHRWLRREGKNSNSTHESVFNQLLLKDGHWGVRWRRPIEASNGRLPGENNSEMETEDGVPFIGRIHVENPLIAREQARTVVDRVHLNYATHWPLDRTFRKSMQLPFSCTLVLPTV